MVLTAAANDHPAPLPGVAISRRRPQHGETEARARGSLRPTCVWAMVLSLVTAAAVAGPSAAAVVLDKAERIGADGRAQRVTLSDRQAVAPGAEGPMEQR